MEIYHTRYGWLIASERDGQYQASLTPRAARETGCHTAFARTVEQLASHPGVQCYAREDGARRRLRALGAL